VCELNVKNAFVRVEIFFDKSHNAQPMLAQKRAHFRYALVVLFRSIRDGQPVDP
jgi:hypothetical protein